MNNLGSCIFHLKAYREKLISTGGYSDSRLNSYLETLLEAAVAETATSKATNPLVQYLGIKALIEKIKEEDPNGELPHEVKQSILWLEKHANNGVNM